MVIWACKCDKQFNISVISPNLCSDTLPALQLVGGIGVTMIDFYSNIVENFVDLWSSTAAVLLYFIMDTLTSKLKSGEIRFDQEDQVYLTFPNGLR